MKTYESCDVQTAMVNVVKQNQVYMLVPVTKDMTIEQIFNAAGYVIEVQVGSKPKAVVKAPAVDDAKIMALKKAGRSIQKIADELNVSDQTIRNHLKAMEAKNGG